MLRRKNLVNQLTDDLLAAVAEHLLGRRVPEDHAAFGVDHHHGVQGRVANGAQPLFALAERFLGSSLFGQLTLQLCVDVKHFLVGGRQFGGPLFGQAFEFLEAGFIGPIRGHCTVLFGDTATQIPMASRRPSATVACLALLSLSMQANKIPLKEQSTNISSCN